MNNMLITILSLSAFGSVLAGILFLLKPLIKNRVSKTFAYYLWIVILLRLCLPFGVSLSVPAGWFGNEATEMMEALPQGSEYMSKASGAGQAKLNNPWAQTSGQSPEEQLGVTAPDPSPTMKRFPLMPAIHRRAAYC